MLDLRMWMAMQSVVEKLYHNKRMELKIGFRLKPSLLMFTITD